MYHTDRPIPDAANSPLLDRAHTPHPANGPLRERDGASPSEAVA
ncbi:hypothetical protein [Halorubrum distributum]|nr:MULTISPECIES: hypothetical protein [Halorubrum distributum group]